MSPIISTLLCLLPLWLPYIILIIVHIHLARIPQPSVDQLRRLARIGFLIAGIPSILVVASIDKQIQSASEEDQIQLRLIRNEAWIGVGLFVVVCAALTIYWMGNFLS